MADKTKKTAPKPPATPAKAPPSPVPSPRATARRQALIAVESMLGSQSRRAAAIADHFDKGAGLFPARK